MLVNVLERIARHAHRLSEEVDGMMFGCEPRPWIRVKTGPGAFVAFPLQPFRSIIMDVTLMQGHTLTNTITWLDQHGNPMLKPVTYDAPPVWSDTTPATIAFTVAPDNLSEVGVPAAVGTDVVSVSFAVGGVPFNLTQNVTVTEEEQIPTTADITPTVN